MYQVGETVRLENSDTVVRLLDFDGVTNTYAARRLTEPGGWTVVKEESIKCRTRLDWVDEVNDGPAK